MNSTSNSSLQQPAPTTPAPATEYVAVPNGGEQYNGGQLMVGAYAAIWVVLMVWILLLWKKQAALGARLEGLERTIDRAAAAIDAKKKS